MEGQTRIHDAKLVSIGNSKGIRIPKYIIQKYGFAGDLLIEETATGLLVRPKHDEKMSWADTYKAMAEEDENWDDFDAVLLDGLEEDDSDA